MLTAIIAFTAALEAVIIITLGSIIKMCVRENVKLVRGVARSKNPEAFAGVYNDNGKPHKKHVSLAKQQEESMRSGGDD